jgi:hypothetical protein
VVPRLCRLGTRPRLAPPRRLARATSHTHTQPRPGRVRPAGLARPRGPLRDRPRGLLVAGPARPPPRDSRARPLLNRRRRRHRLAGWRTRGRQLDPLLLRGRHAGQDRTAAGPVWVPCGWLGFTSPTEPARPRATAAAKRRARHFVPLMSRKLAGAVQCCATPQLVCVSQSCRLCAAPRRRRPRSLACTLAAAGQTRAPGPPPAASPVPPPQPPRSHCPIGLLADVARPERAWRASAPTCEAAAMEVAARRAKAEFFSLPASLTCCQFVV